MKNKLVADVSLLANVKKDHDCKEYKIIDSLEEAIERLHKLGLTFAVAPYKVSSEEPTTCDEVTKMINEERLRHKERKAMLNSELTQVRAMIDYEVCRRWRSNILVPLGVVGR